MHGLVLLRPGEARDVRPPPMRSGSFGTRVLLSCSERRQDRRRIEAAAQRYRGRNVRPHADLQASKRRFRNSSACFERSEWHGNEVVHRVPPPPVAYTVVRDLHAVTRPQRLDSGQQDVIHAVARKTRLDRLRIGDSIEPVEMKKRLQLRRECEAGWARTEIERLHAEAVTRQEQAMLLAVPDREAPHSIEARQASPIPSARMRRGSPPCRPPYGTAILPAPAPGAARENCRSRRCR